MTKYCHEQFRNVLGKLFLMQLLFFVVSGGGIFGDRHRTKSSCDYSFHWREATDRSKNSYHDDIESHLTEKHYLKKKRLRLFHFGRQPQFEGKDANCNASKNDHPLRTNLWEMNVKWSLLSSKTLPSARGKNHEKEKLVQLELDPEGYVRLLEHSSHDMNRDFSDPRVLGMGRWRKRPWGVTILIRPFFINDEKKTLNMIDERTEYIFQARNFHWNGFGCNPKLTQGTILLQKQNRKTKQKYWWKSTAWAHSSILPTWSEELSNIRSGWFRPVIGTFTAKGVIRE